MLISHWQVWATEIMMGWDKVEATSWRKMLTSGNVKRDRLVVRGPELFPMKSEIAHHSLGRCWNPWASKIWPSTESFLISIIPGSLHSKSSESILLHHPPAPKGSQFGNEFHNQSFMGSFLSLILGHYINLQVIKFQIMKASPLYFYWSNGFCYRICICFWEESCCLKKCPLLRTLSYFQ